MKNSFRLPSPALVISILALVVALSGTAIAAKRYLITNTRQISPAALTQLAKLVAVQAKQGAPGAPGAAGATGAAGTNGVNGERGAPGPGAIVYWAVVNANGSLARHGTSGVAVEKLGEGNAGEEGSYVVKFESDVSQCAYEAAIGRADAENTENPGFATVVARAGEPHGVEVQTYNVGSELKDKGFHLAVFC